MSPTRPHYLRPFGASPEFDNPRHRGGYIECFSWEF